MPLSKEADDIARLINNHRKQSGNVTSQHVHVECFQFGHSGIPAAKDDLARHFMSEADLRFNDDRMNRASQTTDAFLGYEGLETKCR